MSCCGRRARSPAALAVLGVALAGCSSMYYDRRDTVSFGAQDAVAANQVIQMVDPWPAAAANRNLTTHGQVIEAAVGRYRAGQVIPPRGTGTSSAKYDPVQQGMASAAPPPIK